MKTLLLLLIVLGSLFSFSTYSQKLDSATVSRLSPEQQKEVKDLLKSAKNEKTTGYVFLISGGALMIAGGIWAGSNYEIFSTEEQENEAEKGTIVFIAGGVASLVSIPIFVSARNKRNAANKIMNSAPVVRVNPQFFINGRQSFGIKVSIPICR
jgi:Ni,Fe-hydrogenase I small subunit